MKFEMPEVEIVKLQIINPVANYPDWWVDDPMSGPDTEHGGGENDLPLG